MNRYVLLFRGGAVVHKELAPAELGAHLEKWRTWLDQLAKREVVEPNGPRLQLTGRTLRGRGKAVTDGPFAEAKDMVTGQIIVRAESLDAAAAIASECPVYEYDGSVEVRPIFEMRG